MKKTVCELFAGVGGFRCGLNNINNIEDVRKSEKWETVWFSQWEPADKKIQWAHDCYVNRFGTCLDLEGRDTTNCDIHEVNKSLIPDHSLCVFGFPCQDYSVSQSLKTSKGIEGKKGVLWWDVRDLLEAKNTPFALGENVDRLIKSPAKQRGRDFGIILACLRDLDYTVEWRVINAAEYGYQQRRRRVFIFAYKNDTNYAKKCNNLSILDLVSKEGFFAKQFAIQDIAEKDIKSTELPRGIGELSASFTYNFENAGVMRDGQIYTVKTTPDYDGKQVTLGDIMEDGDVDKTYFVPEEKVYYTYPDIDHSDETLGKLPTKQRQTWQYLKGAKKLARTAANGHEYIYSEGPIALFDSYDKPARTMLTSEGSFSRTTHLLKDKKTGKARLLTPIECERIQGFPDDWTKECLVNGEIIPMTIAKRRFMMGNALVVNLIKDMEIELSAIIDNEQ